MIKKCSSKFGRPTSGGLLKTIRRLVECLHVAGGAKENLNPDYVSMARDAQREAEAFEWSEALISDASP